LLLPGLSVRQILPARDHLTIVAAPTSRSVLCPVCGKRSARRHSRYLRTLSDLPHQGRVARLQVWVRRFRCDTASCPRRIFAERLPELAPVQARRTRRLAVGLLALAHERGCEADLAEVLAGQLADGGMPDLAALCARFAPQTAPQPTPEVVVTLPPIASYDALLSDVAAASGATA
jgi:hypothetical protein